MKKQLLISCLSVLFSIFCFAQPGEIDNTFNPIGEGPFGNAHNIDASCNIYKTKVYKDGPNKDKLIIVGRFITFNNVNAQYIARLNADGSVDTTFANPLGPIPDNSTSYLYTCEILPNDKILIGGQFTVTIGGITYRNFIQLNENGTIDTTFNAVTGTRWPNGLVHAICVQQIGPDWDGDDKIYIGGAFTNYNNSAGTRRVMRINSDGTPDLSYATVGTVNNEVRALALQTTSSGDCVLVGGFFTEFTGGIVKGRLLRLTPSGGLDNTFNPTGTSFNNDVYDILVRPNGNFYAVGAFTSYNYNGTAYARRSIVQLTPSGSLTNAISIGTLGDRYVFTIKFQSDGNLLIGGNFTYIGNATTATSNGTPIIGTKIPKGIARIKVNPTTGVHSLDNTFLTATAADPAEWGFVGGTEVYQGESVIRDLAFQDDQRIIVGGDYLRYDGTARRMVARIKTRVCPSAAVYRATTGWTGGTQPFSQDHYVAISSGTLTIPSGQHWSACELDIKPGATLVVQGNASITVKGAVMNNGTFTVNDNGSLVQINDDVPNTDLGSGVFTMKRKTAMVKKFDFTYWSSPVESISLHDVSPLTRFDKYFKYDASVAGEWVTIMNGAEMMTPARGYIMRAPDNFSATVAAQYEVNFTGRPNNGTVTSIPLQSGAASKWNLIGNPYPSPISMSSFFALASNAAALDGTIYIWTHQTDPAAVPGNTYQYSASDYMTVNSTGAVLTAPSGVAAFDGKIAAGQSFFIKSNVNGAVATFKNSMRANTGGNFYRNAAQNDSMSTFSNESGSGIDRFWLDLSNEQGAFNQMLMGYLPQATAGFDNGYDGEKLSGYYVSFYSLIGADKYTIQGRGLFTVEDEVPLGYYAFTPGTLKVTMSNYEGLFQDQDVYLVDSVANVTHNLKNGPYEFTTAAGTFDNRFKIVYQSDLLDNPEFTDTENAVQVVTGDHITVRSSTQEMTAVIVYDILGKKLYSSAAGLSEKMLDITSIEANNQVLLVHIELADGTKAIRKVIF